MRGRGEAEQRCMNTRASFKVEGFGKDAYEVCRGRQGSGRPPCVCAKCVLQLLCREQANLGLMVCAMLRVPRAP